MDLTKQMCVPCEGGTKPFTRDEAQTYLSTLKGWELIEDNKIGKKFTCKNFLKSLALVNGIGVIAEREGHHPNIHIYYNSVKFELSTHAIGGLSLNDFIMAARIDQYYNREKYALS